MSGHPGISSTASGVRDGNAERNAEIIRRREVGEGPRQLAREMGISPNVVLGVLRRAGLTDPGSPHAIKTPRPGSGVGQTYRDDVCLDARALREDGLTYREIAMAVGITGANPGTAWALIHRRATPDTSERSIHPREAS